MEEDFSAYLLAQTALTALVEQRINWNTRPQASALPAVTLQVISAVPQNDQCGADLLHESRVQIDVWANTFASVKAVSRAVLAAVSGLSFSHNGTAFEIYVESAVDETEQASTGSATIHRTRIDVLIWHRQEN